MDEVGGFVGSMHDLYQSIGRTIGDVLVVGKKAQIIKGRSHIHRDCYWKVPDNDSFEEREAVVAERLRERGGEIREVLEWYGTVIPLFEGLEAVANDDSGRISMGNIFSGVNGLLTGIRPVGYELYSETQNFWRFPTHRGIVEDYRIARAHRKELRVLWSNIVDFERFSVPVDFFGASDELKIVICQLRENFGFELDS